MFEQQKKNLTIVIAYTNNSILRLERPRLFWFIIIILNKPNQKKKTTQWLDRINYDSNIENWN